MYTTVRIFPNFWASTATFHLHNGAFLDEKTTHTDNIPQRTTTITTKIKDDAFEGAVVFLEGLKGSSYLTAGILGKTCKSHGMGRGGDAHAVTMNASFVPYL